GQLAKLSLSLLSSAECVHELAPALCDLLPLPGLRFRDPRRRLLETCWRLGRRGGLSRLTLMLLLRVALGRGHEREATSRSSSSSHLYRPLRWQGPSVLCRGSSARRRQLPYCLVSGRSTISACATSSAIGRCRVPRGTTKRSPRCRVTGSRPSTSTRKLPSQHRNSSSSSWVCQGNSPSKRATRTTVSFADIRSRGWNGPASTAIALSMEMAVWFMTSSLVWCARMPRSNPCWLVGYGANLARGPAGAAGRSTARVTRG